MTSISPYKGGFRFASGFAEPSYIHVGSHSLEPAPTFTIPYTFLASCLFLSFHHALGVTPCHCEGAEELCLVRSRRCVIERTPKKRPRTQCPRKCRTLLGSANLYAFCTMRSDPSPTYSNVDTKKTRSAKSGPGFLSTQVF